MRVAAIVPAWNAAGTIGACLLAIKGQSHPIDALLLFDDGSDDDTSRLASDLGAEVLHNRGRPVGPACGRNRAAAVADADLLLFVDADVVLARDAVERLVESLEEASVVAAFGSYDTNPPSRRLSSIYANLRHHFIHQNGDREAQTFWTGIGLVRRDSFLALGGFNAALFPHPSIEDVELGARLRAAGGRIRLVPEAKGAHWKDWRLTQLWNADICRRAYPWSKLILQGKAATSALNLSHAERLKALLSGCVFLSLLLSIFSPPLLLAAAAFFGLYVIANRDFLALVRRHAGMLAAAASAVLHCCYHLYSAATFSLVAITTKLGLLKRCGR